jgi:hypothetical protein
MTTMDVIASTDTAISQRRGGGRLGRRAMRSAPVASFPTLVRNIPVYEIVPDEAVELIHEESMKPSSRRSAASSATTKPSPCGSRWAPMCGTRACASTARC